MLFMKRAWVGGGVESDPFKDARRARATCRSLGLHVVPEGPSQLHTTNVCNPQPAADPHGGCSQTQPLPPSTGTTTCSGPPAQALGAFLAFSIPPLHIQPNSESCWLCLQNLPRVWQLPTPPVPFTWTRLPSLLAWRCSWAPYHELGLSTNYSPCGSQEAALLLNTLPGFLTALGIKSELHTVTPKTCRVWPYLPPLPHLLRPSALPTSHTGLLILRHTSLFPASAFALTALLCPSCGLLPSLHSS